MQQLTLLHKKFAKELPLIHKIRLNSLMSPCIAASIGNKLTQAQDNAVHIVNIYRQRMRIEENFRDTKCSRYGQGLRHSLTKSPERMAIILLIAAIATFAAWIAGLITVSKGKASDFQAHSAKFTNALSLVYLGREAIKKKLRVSYFQVVNAINALTSMVIEAQLEEHVYE